MSWHHCIHFLSNVVKIVDKIGEFGVNIMGLNKSRFSYVMDTMSQEEWEIVEELEKERIERNCHKQMEEGRNDNPIIVTHHESSKVNKKNA